jgi:valyl-tRNA synthetase
MADTAIAVHPGDERYRHLVGQTAIVPLVDREVPIIADDYVKTDFGTGVLKVTPGHDPNDFEIGRRHALPELSAIGFDGRMTELAGKFARLTAAEARERVRDALVDQQLIAKEEPYEHEVGHCDRTGDRVEPLISLQWFMRMDELAKPANQAVRSGRVRFHPKSQENTYFSWMDNLRPWCISRQLWWGHQIPVWYCPDGHVTVEMDEPPACAECGSGELTRDPDVLDTWFSAALWPFATIGWPGEDPRLERFYPGHVLSTARDIINLWVARMLMMGIELMGDIPFSDVLIHSTIQAPDGRRMSKSLGTGIDPLKLVEEFGADATRYGLLKMSSTQDVRFDRGAIEEGSKLANKLWNASRFVVSQADAVEVAEPSGAGLPVQDRWIRSRFDEALADVLRQIDGYDFSAAVKTLYAFVYNDFCDWYIELSKPALAPEDAERRRAASQTLHWVLDGVLRMAHPIMPFVTEAIWAHLPSGADGPLMLASYPTPDPGRRDADATARMDEHVRQVREARRAAQDAAEADNGPSDEERLKQASAELERAKRMLANEGFLAKAPPAKVEEEREKERRFSARVKEIKAQLAQQ